MRYESFKIIDYKGIIGTNIHIHPGLSPFIGVNESGKSTILEAIACFDKDNDILYNGQFINNDLITSKFNRNDNPKIVAEIHIDETEAEDFIKQLFNDLFEDFDKPFSLFYFTSFDAEKKKTYFETVTPQLWEEIKEPLLDIIDNISFSKQPPKLRIQREFGSEEGRYNLLLEDNDLFDLSFNIDKDKRIELKNSDIPVIEVLSNDDTKYYLRKNILAKCEYIVNYILDLLPPIIYIDDFKDMIPDQIKKSDSEQYERIKYIACNMIEMEVSESNFDNLDSLGSADQSTVLAQISKIINEYIGRAWNENHILKNGFQDNLFRVDINLEYRDGCFEFLIRDIDKEGNIKNSYNFNQRSKGFKWYFNYLFKVSFNNKIARRDTFVDSEQKRIILLDEPGVYLHAAFQKELLRLLKRDAEVQRSNIIYTTHLENLLSPDIINVNTINIVSKSANGILVETINNSKGPKLYGSFDPIWNAIHLKSFPTDISDKNVAVVEGLTDMIILKLLQERSLLNQELIILPAGGAPFQDTLVALCLGLSKHVLLLFDNDKEGCTACENIKAKFGDISRTLKEIISDDELTVTNLESLYNNDEIKLIKEPLKANLISLYYENKDSSKRKRLLRCLVKNESFKLLAKNINEYFAVTS